MTTPRTRFPTTLYVKTEKDGTTSYFVADDDPDALVSMGEKVRIATYKLDGVRDAVGIAKFE